MYFTRRENRFEMRNLVTHPEVDEKHKESLSRSTFSPFISFRASLDRAELEGTGLASAGWTYAAVRGLA